MANIAVVAVIAVIVGFAVRFIIKEKKRGVKCVGCPYAESCASKAKGGCH